MIIILCVFFLINKYNINKLFFNKNNTNKVFFNKFFNFLQFFDKKRKFFSKLFSFPFFNGIFYIIKSFDFGVGYEKENNLFNHYDGNNFFSEWL